MPTNTAFLVDALKEIGVVADGEIAQNSDLQDSLAVMNRMMAAWSLSDKEVGYFPQDQLGDTVPIPIWAEEGVQANLSIKLASLFRIPVTLELIDKAADGRNAIARICINNKLEGADMDHMPWGSNYYDNNILTDS